MNFNSNNNLISIISCLVLILSMEHNIYAQGCCCGIDSEINVPGGDFEVAPFPPAGGWIDYNTGEVFGAGWEVISGSISHHDDGHNNLGNGNPNPSTAHVDLNGFNIGAICQDISGFTVGQEYIIVFYYAIHNAVGVASASVQIDGGSVLNESWDANNQGQNNWLEATYAFVASSPTMDLCFYSESNVNCCGMLIDDIEIFSCIQDLVDPIFTSPPSNANYQCFMDVPPFC